MMCRVCQGRSVPGQRCIVGLLVVLVAVLQPALAERPYSDPSDGHNFRDSKAIPGSNVHMDRYHSTQWGMQAADQFRSQRDRIGDGAFHSRMVPGGISHEAGRPVTLPPGAALPGTPMPGGLRYQNPNHGPQSPYFNRPSGSTYEERRRINTLQTEWAAEQYRRSREQARRDTEKAQAAYAEQRAQRGTSPFQNQPVQPLPRGSLLHKNQPPAGKRVQGRVISPSPSGLPRGSLLHGAR